MLRYIPVSERKLCEFVANTAKEGLKHQTIKSYLSAVRHLQILVGLGDPFSQNMPMLEYVLRGVKSVEVKCGELSVLITCHFLYISFPVSLLS